MKIDCTLQQGMKIKAVKYEAIFNEDSWVHANENLRRIWGNLEGTYMVSTKALYWLVFLLFTPSVDCRTSIQLRISMRLCLQLHLMLCKWISLQQCRLRRKIVPCLCEAYLTSEICDSAEFHSWWLKWVMDSTPSTIGIPSKPMRWYTKIINT